MNWALLKDWPKDTWLVASLPPLVAGFLAIVSGAGWWGFVAYMLFFFMGTLMPRWFRTTKAVAENDRWMREHGLKR